MATPAEAREAKRRTVVHAAVESDGMLARWQWWTRDVFEACALAGGGGGGAAPHEQLKSRFDAYVDSWFRGRGHAAIDLWALLNDERLGLGPDGKFGQCEPYQDKVSQLHQVLSARFAPEDSGTFLEFVRECLTLMAADVLKARLDNSRELHRSLCAWFKQASDVVDSRSSASYSSFAKARLATLNMDPRLPRTCALAAVPIVGDPFLIELLLLLGAAHGGDDGIGDNLAAFTALAVLRDPTQLLGFFAAEGLGESVERRCRRLLSEKASGASSSIATDALAAEYAAIVQAELARAVAGLPEAFRGISPLRLMYAVERRAGCRKIACAHFDALRAKTAAVHRPAPAAAPEQLERLRGGLRHDLVVTEIVAAFDADVFQRLAAHCATTAAVLHWARKQLGGFAAGVAAEVPAAVLAGFGAGFLENTIFPRCGAAAQRPVRDLLPAAAGGLPAVFPKNPVRTPREAAGTPEGEDGGDGALWDCVAEAVQAHLAMEGMAIGLDDFSRIIDAALLKAAAGQLGPELQAAPVRREQALQLGELAPAWRRHREAVERRRGATPGPKGNRQTSARFPFRDILCAHVEEVAASIAQMKAALVLSGVSPSPHRSRTEPFFGKGAQVLPGCSAALATHPSCLIAPIHGPAKVDARISTKRGYFYKVVTEDGESRRVLPEWALSPSPPLSTAGTPSAGDSCRSALLEKCIAVAVPGHSTLPEGDCAQGIEITSYCDDTEEATIHDDTRSVQLLQRPHSRSANIDRCQLPMDPEEDCLLPQVPDDESWSKQGLSSEVPYDSAAVHLCENIDRAQSRKAHSPEKEAAAAAALPNVVSTTKYDDLPAPCTPSTTATSVGLHHSPPAVPAASLSSGVTAGSSKRRKGNPDEMYGVSADSNHLVSCVRLLSAENDALRESVAEADLRYKALSSRYTDLLNKYTQLVTEKACPSATADQEGGNGKPDEEPTLPAWSRSQARPHAASLQGPA
ncbi:hypothetical protein DIPPA_27538 [Diplonema papillatum]|nr:hypothetical protein DIPPA_27538 [Diplonema papillatum]